MNNKTMKQHFAKEFTENGIREVLRYGKILIDSETSDNSRYRMVYYKDCIWFIAYHDGNLADWYVFEHKEPCICYDNELPFP